MARATVQQTETALAEWGLEGAVVSTISSGLINDSFFVDHSGERFVLQRVNPIFPTAIHNNIRAVTAHLASKGLTTPRLLPNRDGGWFSEIDGSVWRVMQRVPGESLGRLDTSTAHEAGRMLGAFHRALSDLQHEFVGLRTGVHDTPAHLERLRHALANSKSHRLYSAVEPLAQDLLRHAQSLPSIAGSRSRVVHGDPKFQNLLFTHQEPRQAVCWVDLDTVGPAPLATELGDAWRSWCNPAGEDENDATFALPIYEASLSGYVAVVGKLDHEEQAGILHGVEWITLELAARFAADTLHESYFGWDATRFASQGEHNLVRARGQWSLYQQVLSTRSQRQTITQRVLGL